MKVKVYGQGDYKDEGGHYHFEERSEPFWVELAQKWCSGCYNNFYNGRANCTGDAWCFSLKKTYVKRKTRPSCYC